MSAKRTIPTLLLAAVVAGAACGKKGGSGEETSGPGPATGDTTGSMSQGATGTTSGAGPGGGTVTVSTADSAAAADSGKAGAAPP